MRQILRDILDDALLERRWRAIGLAPRRLARRLHPFGNVGRKVVGPGGNRCAGAQDGATRHRRAGTQKVTASRARGFVVGVERAAHLRILG